MNSHLHRQWKNVQPFFNRLSSTGSVVPSSSFGNKVFLTRSCGAGADCDLRPSADSETSTLHLVPTLVSLHSNYLTAKSTVIFGTRHEQFVSHRHFSSDTGFWQHQHTKFRRRARKLQGEERAQDDSRCRSKKSCKGNKNKKHKNGQGENKDGVKKETKDKTIETPNMKSGFSASGSSSFMEEKDEYKFSDNYRGGNTTAKSVNHSPIPSMKSLKPSEVVEFLNQHIIGQLEAKKAVANALRNRWRRQQLLNADLRNDIAPKNILMIGPTGVGKTEIARRMAKILEAPFIKVEATKYTEVGFHGKDVDTIIKDLVEMAVRQQYTRLETEFYPQAQRVADEKVLNVLTGQLTIEADVNMYNNLRTGLFDPQLILVDVPYSPLQGTTGSGGIEGFFSEFSDSSDFTAPSSSTNYGGYSQGGWKTTSSSNRSRERTEKRTMSVKEARTALANAEFSRILGLITKARITQEALDAVEQEGIVFLDEIDKICSSKSHAYSGPDASAEGVQRDLLPLIEGTTINTRYGNVKTDHILFIASGAFHSVKPSDMMAELQGRLPVRVELKPLTEEDFRKILTETRHNLIEQNIALLSTEGVSLLFEPGASDEIARIAYQVNSYVENIGARRLVTIIEKIMEEINFTAPEMEEGSQILVTPSLVRQSVARLTENTDLHKFIL